MRGTQAILIVLSLFTAGLPADAQTVADYRHIVLDGHALKWGKPEYGSGALVTYALVQEPMDFDHARNCGSLGPIEALLTGSGVSRDVFDRELSAALRIWESAANISFSPATPGEADILIGAQRVPTGYAFANVEYDRRADGGGVRSLLRSLVCLNPEKRWKVGFDGDLEVYDLRYTLIHELGHAIGLDHPAIAGQLMAYRYGEKFRALQPGDIRGITELYGSRPSLVGSSSLPAIRNSRVH